MNATAETADLATFTEETLYEKFFFLCSVFSITLHDNLHVLDKEVMYAVKTNETMIFLSLEYFFSANICSCKVCSFSFRIIHSTNNEFFNNNEKRFEKVP